MNRFSRFRHKHNNTAYNAINYFIQLFNIYYRIISTIFCLIPMIDSQDGVRLQAL